MKVSYNWLRQYIDFKVDPKDLAGKLTMAGLETKSIDERGGDFIFEIEITSNRPDCLSIYGIAREIRGIFGSKLKPIKADLLKGAKLKKPSIKIEDRKGCLRYVGRVMEGVEIGPSPKWLIERIEAVGLRPVNNVVDITNFCLLESGQPLHAFDHDKLDGGRIIVRRAKRGEEIATIDNVNRKLDENILVIADARKPVAIAGIMGGKDTEVGLSTKRILLESAYFDPPTIRMAAKRLGVSTESSYRFERSVDLRGVLPASNRAAQLICDLAKAKAISSATDEGMREEKRKRIEFRISRANKILGTAIPMSKCSAILRRLGLKARQKGKGALEVDIPSFRRDLKEEIDLAEEAARIYGYDKVPETLTRISIWGKGSQKSSDRIVEQTIRQALIGMGLNEAITYSLISKDSSINKIMNAQEDNLLKVRNPLSSEYEVLRPSLLGGLLDVLAYNINRKISDIRIFELGKVYGVGTAPSEKGALAIALCGMKVKDWKKKEALDIFDLKGTIEAFLEKVGILEYEFEAKPFPIFAPSASSSIKVAGKDIGLFGKASKALLDRYDIKNPIFISELDLNPIFSYATLERKFAELPRYPSVVRDISLIVDDKVSNKEIVDLIRKTCGESAVSINPFDLYRGEQVPKGSKSILYSVEYRACDRTLTDEEVNGLDKKVREALATALNARIR